MSKLCDYQLEDMDSNWGNVSDPTAAFFANFPMWSGYTMLLIGGQHINLPRDRIMIGSKGGKLYYSLEDGDSAYYVNRINPIPVTYETLKKTIEGRISRKQGVLYYHQERVKEFLNELSSKQGTKVAVPERSNGVVT